jgi:NhaA family Na+:H+ antiporter
MTTHALPHRTLALADISSPGALFHYVIEHFLLLPIGGLIALIWANVRPDSYFAMTHTLSFTVNEIGMALFFALITQEIVEEVMPGGALHTWRRWTLPVVAAVGAMFGAALVYAVYVGLKYEPVLAPGWPAAAAVDLAFAYFLVRAIFGRRHPAIPFLLLLGITVNLLGMFWIASRQPFVEVRPGGAALMVVAISLAYALRRAKVHSVWPYLAVCGPLSWFALYFDGLHPAFALVPVVPFLPHMPRNLDMFADEPHARHESPRYFEHVLNYPVQAVLFLFGLVNAGVILSGYGTGTWALLTAAVIGKPLGMLAGVGLAVALGLHMPLRLHWRDVAVVALATSGGFTFGLFFATAIFPLGPILAELKIGAVATGIGVPLAIAAAWLLRAGRFGHHAHQHPPRSHHARPHAATIVVAVLGLTAVSSAAAQPAASQDEATGRLVIQRLMEKEIVGVTVQVDNGIVTLRGTVPTLWVKRRAIAEANKVTDAMFVLSELTVPRGESDARIAEAVARRVQRYVFFTIFDDVEVEVHKGIVTLTGRVTMPHKTEALLDLAEHEPGVQEARSRIQTLPVSRFDDELRYAIARNIYGDALFARYAIQANPPIHIIVEHGAVTLTGVVNSEVERRKAEAIARNTFAVISVTSKLRVERED